MAKKAIRGKGNFYLKLGKVTPSAILTQTKGDVNINISNGEVETTSDSEVGHQSYIAGDYNGTISGTFNYSDIDSSAEAQEDILEASTTGEDLFVEWAYETGSGLPKRTATCFVTSFGSTNGSPMTQSFTLRIKDEVAVGVQL